MKARTITHLLISAVLALLLTGCASTVSKTVENRLAFTGPNGESLDAAGHKDTTIKGLKIVRKDGTKIDVEEYQSVGNAAAIAEAGAAERSNQAMLSLLTALIGRQLAPALPTPPAPAPAADPAPTPE